MYIERVHSSAKSPSSTQANDFLFSQPASVSDEEVMQRGKGKRKADDLDASDEVISVSKRAHLEDRDQTAVARFMSQTNGEPFHAKCNLLDTTTPGHSSRNSLDSYNISYDLDGENYYLQDLFGEFKDPQVAMPANMDPTYLEESEQLPIVAQAVDEQHYLGDQTFSQTSTETNELPFDTFPLPDSSNSYELKEGGYYEDHSSNANAQANTALISEGVGTPEAAAEKDSEPVPSAPYKEIVFSVELPRAVLADIPAPPQQVTAGITSTFCTWSNDGRLENMCRAPLTSLNGIYEHLAKVHDYRGQQARKEAKAAQKAKGQKAPKEPKGGDERWACRLMKFDEKKGKWKKCDNNKGHSYSPRGENVKKHVDLHFVPKESGYEGA
ncbi:hypothetical protein VNI00_006486 [Paramarasmius palmivorus]|uniref:Uncharacterized protein n=1 Tax=Paramarasmius palmivorus TaxID=297713 RepID=A0AAW0D5E9_9AGAR